MAEALAYSWLFSFLLSVPITAWNIRSAIKAANSEQIKVLNRNLAQVGLFWSSSSDSFQSLAESDPDRETKNSIRNYGFLGGLGLLNIPGLFFLIIVSVSIPLILGKEKQAILESDLAKTELDLERIRELVPKFSKI